MTLQSCEIKLFRNKSEKQIKMAEGVQLVLCSPLCFLVKKYSQSQAKVLKTALLDFLSLIHI